MSDAQVKVRQDSWPGGGWLGFLGLALALCMVAALHPALQGAKAYRAAFSLSEEEQEQVNSSAFGLILGEARASLADLMWVKTERYLHRGVAYKPHVSAAEMAHTGQAVTEAPQEHGAAAGHAADDDHDHDADHHEHEESEGPAQHHHDEGKLVALVPAAEQDYRGFIGTIHRAVAPYLPPGAPDEHAGGQELLPWYRVLTYSNPHHWRGYLIGAWWLTGQRKKDPQALGEAEKFIDEGIRNNPEAFQLQLMRGRMLMMEENWREAMRAFEQTMVIAQKIRPAGGQEHLPQWSLSDEEDFDAAARYIPIIQLHKLNDPAAARISLTRMMTLIPNDGPLTAMQKQLAGK